MEREWEVLRREASLLPPPFFTREVAVRANGGEAVVVAREQIRDVSTASIVSRRVSFGTMSVSGRHAAVRSAEIQFFLNRKMYLQNCQLSKFSRPFDKLISERSCKRDFQIG